VLPTAETNPTKPRQRAEQRIDLLWPQVHALTLLAQLRSFTQVAQRLGLSKAAVSQRVAELERAVGQPLVQRTTRSVRLTDAGQRLVEHTGESFAQIERSVGEARDLAAQPRGLLRAHPDIRIELDLSDRLVTLAHEGFDLAIRHTSAPPDNHVAWKLRESHSLLVASRAYLRRHGSPAHPSELAAHACLPYLRPGPALWKFELAGNPRRPRSDPERVSVIVQGPLRANNSEIVRGAALAGLGIALLPDFSAASELRSGRLAAVLPQWRPIGFFGDAIYAMRPWSPRTPKAVQVLVEHLRGAFGA